MSDSTEQTDSDRSGTGGRHESNCCGASIEGHEDGSLSCSNCGQPLRTAVEDYNEPY